MIIRIILLTFCLSFAACEITKSEEYYKENLEIAKKRANECRMKSIISQDCINAFKVAFPKGYLDLDENSTQE